MKIERAELRTVVRLSAAHFLVMAAMYVLKPVRNAIFLERAGIAQLPFATIAVAVFGAVAGLVYARLAKKTPLPSMIVGSFAVALAALLAFRFTLGNGGITASYAFFVTVQCIGFITTSLVWLLANDLFDARQARRLFGSIGAAGIAGAVGGGITTRYAAHALGSDGLVTTAIVLYALALFALRSASPVQVAPEEPERSSIVAEPAAQRTTFEVLSSALLRSVTAMTAIGAIVSVFVDMQYNDVVARSFASRDEKTAFFGMFFAVLSAAAFLWQVLITPRVLHARGVGAALLFLPIALACGSAAVLFTPTLLAASGLKLADGSLRHSIHKSATEILVVPVPAAVRARTKVFLDATVGTASEAIGAAAVLLLCRVLGFSYSSLGAVSIVLVVVWVLLTRRARLAYVDAFRHALERREIDLAELRTPVLDKSATLAMKPALASKNERAVAYALDLLVDARDTEIAEAARPLLAHESARVRRRAVRLMRLTGVSLGSEIATLIRDDDPRVRLEALIADGPERFRDHLASHNPRIRAAAIDYAGTAEATDTEREAVSEELVRSLLEDASDDATVRAQIARACGGLPRLRSVLRELVLDRDARVIDSAIASIGRSRDDGFVPWLVDRLAEARYRKQARSALATFGDAAVQRIAEVLDSPASSRALKRQLPRALGAIPTASSVHLLEKTLATGTPALAEASVKALGVLHRTHPALALDRAALERVLLEAVKEHGALGQVLDACSSMESALLSRALREKRARLSERTFRILALLYGEKQMMDAYYGVSSAVRTVRAQAIEFLDNVLERRIATPVLRMIEEERSAKLTLGQALDHLADGRDAWLRACAVWCAAPQFSLATRLLEDPELIVREAAEVRCSPSSRE